MKRPHWELSRVKILAAQPNGLFVQVKRASSFFGGDARAAKVACLSAIQSLAITNFSETVAMTWDVCDVYGVRRADGSGWYLKLTIDEAQPEVAVVSFHPLERPLKTNGGIVRP